MTDLLEYICAIKFSANIQVLTHNSVLELNLKPKTDYTVQLFLATIFVDFFWNNFKKAI